ncbi:MAG: hypothetical protein ABIH36_03690, partial [bacterium]
GWYEITAYTDTNTVTLDRAPDGGVGGVSSGVGEVGGARAVPTDAFFEALTAGNTVYLKVGTYTLTENVNIANDGTYALPITVKGYNTARGDNPTGDSRPTIAANAYDWTFDNYWTIRNLILTTTDLFGFYVGLSNIIENCKSTNNSPTANRSAFLLSSNSKLINSEGVSTNGDAVSLSTYNGVIGSYLHDSNIGISSTHRVNKILFNIINTNTTGISAINTSYNRGHSIVDNTIYNSTTGITLTTTQLSSFMNNIIDSNTTGASATSEYKSNWWDYNNWSNNGADVSNVTKGDNALALDPGFTDAPNGIFTIASSLAAKAFPGLFPGALTTGYLDTGAVQRQESTPTPTPSPTPATSPSLIIKGGPLLFKGGYTIK